MDPLRYLEIIFDHHLCHPAEYILLGVGIAAVTLLNVVRGDAPDTDFTYSFRRPWCFFVLFLLIKILSRPDARSIPYVDYLIKFCLVWLFIKILLMEYTRPEKTRLQQVHRNLGSPSAASSILEDD
jgi:hypothetical protein